jgi:hypothetical protein
MQRFNYPLKLYIKAVEKIANDKGLSHVKCKATKGSVVRFELFEVGVSVPCTFWVIHHEHNKKQVVWSKDDYRKAADRLSCTLEELIETIEDFK